MNKDYNTSRKKMILPEYGRNLQMMVDHMLNIEDRETRNKAAQSIIDAMGNLNPQLRDIIDFNHKLWDHLAIMADFKLDIDSPYELPEATILLEKPRKVDYNMQKIRFKHYGKNIEKFIDFAIEMQDGGEKDAFIEMLANHMKKLYLTYNRENVSDHQILSDLADLSKGKLAIPGDIKLAEVKEILNKPQLQQQQQKRKKPMMPKKNMNNRFKRPMM